jgi:hypothetical protein
MSNSLRRLGDTNPILFVASNALNKTPDDKKLNR